MINRLIVRIKKIAAPLIGLAFCTPVLAQVSEDFSVGKTARMQRHIRCMFYNVENLFDTVNDSLTNDEEFLPDGTRSWTASRYWEKLDHIFKTMLALGEWEPPGLVGLCEVENRSVLFDLVSRTPLRKLEYQIIHEESPDPRGIDVALLYRPDQFRPLSHKTYPVIFPGEERARTRDVLYVKGTVFRKDTVHIFINHWPSRAGGQESSAPRRQYVAGLVRSLSDSILRRDPAAAILITGDFNDEPGDESLRHHLKALPDTQHLRSTALYNLMYPYMEKGLGTEKHEAHWNLLDQFIVSGSLLQEHHLHADHKTAYIFAADWLLETDERYLGQRPFRTYAGPRYLGGYSDHLPVYLDLVPGK